MRNMAPEPHSDHHVRLEPAIVPFLFQGRLEMYRADIHADLTQAPSKYPTLRRETARRWWVFGQHKHFHDCCSQGAARFTAACAESKHQNPSSRGVLCASQLSGPNP